MGGGAYIFREGKYLTFLVSCLTIYIIKSVQVVQTG